LLREAPHVSYHHRLADAQLLAHRPPVANAIELIQRMRCGSGGTVRRPIPARRPSRYLCAPRRSGMTEGRHQRSSKIYVRAAPAICNRGSQPCTVCTISGTPARRAGGPDAAFELWVMTM
jgi:hypothetical protein